MDYGWMLYVVLVILLLYVTPHFRGKTMQDLFDDDNVLHHLVHRIGKKHPRGGVWADHSKWMQEEA